jgi:hypothetical protein
MEGLVAGASDAFGGRLLPHPLNIVKDAEPKRKRARAYEVKRFGKKSG